MRNIDRTRWPALDGLRGVAILLVVGFHIAPDIVVAGSWGVTLFFVLSGFLITTILCREKDRLGRIDFRRFFRHRALRLLPALFVVLAFYLIVAGPWALAWPTAAFIANIPLAAGKTVGLGHSWSLAVEEHFYLLWPLVISALPRPWRLRVVGLLGAAAVIWRMALLLTPHTWERVYYATDSNAFALLAGCFLSVLMLEHRRPRTRFGLWPLGMLVAATLVPAFGTTSDSFLWASFLVVGLSVLAVDHGLSGSRVLEMGWLRWLGQVSYGLYLWHTILIHLPWPGPDVAVGLVLSFVVTWLSWRAIETPFLRLKNQLPQGSAPPASALDAAPAG